MDEPAFLGDASFVRFIDVTVAPPVGQVESWSAPTVGQSAGSQDRGGGSTTCVWGKAFRMRCVK